MLEFGIGIGSVMALALFEQLDDERRKRAEINDKLDQLLEDKKS